MNKTVSSITIALLIGLVIALIVASDSKQVIGNENGQAFGKHFQELSFQVPIPQDYNSDYGYFSPPIMIPVKDKPVRVLVSIASVSVSRDPSQEAFQTLPVLIEGTIMYDSALGRMVSHSFCPGPAVGCGLANRHLTESLNFISGEDNPIVASLGNIQSPNAQVTLPPDRLVIHIDPLSNSYQMHSDHFNVLLQMWY